MNFVYAGSIPEVLALIIGTLALWIVASIPLYLASKAIVHDRSQFERALGATFAAAIVFTIFFVIFAANIPLIGPLIGFILILLILMAIYEIGIFRSFALAVITFVIFLLLLFLLAAIGLSIHVFLF